jgi:hypothetical protein
MPLLSLLVFQVIIPFQILHHLVPWYRTPPPSPASVVFNHSDRSGTKDCTDMLEGISDLNPAAPFSPTYWTTPLPLS